MSTARSVFTEAIEDHLALKKQNASIEAVMPLARYDVGDPLDRYPGGPNRAAEGTVVVAEDPADAAPSGFGDIDEPAPAEATQLLVGPSPEQAMEAATALEPAFADRPFEPLTGMAPMLSLVEDIDEDDIDLSAPSSRQHDELPSGDVLRFPGGVGPRDEAMDMQEHLQLDAHLVGDTQAFTVSDDSFTAADPNIDAAVTAHDAPTGEQPVLVIDTDEPLATSDWAEPAAPARAGSSTRRKPRFFGLGRKKQAEDGAGEGWFTDGPRDFNWD